MIVESRVRALATAVRRVAVALDVIERSDPQYKAVEAITARHGRAALAIVVANALVSYRLRVPGEEYWQRYSRWWLSRPTPSSIEDLVKGVVEFLERERLGAAIELKTRRLLRAREALKTVLENPESAANLENLVRMLQRVLKAKGGEKTLFFAAKMAYYALKALGLPVETESPALGMPIDSRIALVTSSSGILEADPATIYTRLRDKAIEAWEKVAKISNIPVIKLDALIWLPARGIEKLLRKGLLASARDEVARRLYTLSRGMVSWSDAELFARELVYRNPYLKR